MRIRLLAAVAIGGMIVGTAVTLLVFDRWYDHTLHVRWVLLRQEILRGIGARMSVLAEGRPPPQTITGFVETGILAEAEVEFDDPLRGVRVTRFVRAVPAGDGFDDLVLLVEQYEPSGEGNVMYVDGDVCFWRQLRVGLERDNERRLAKDLPVATRP